MAFKLTSLFVVLALALTAVAFTPAAQAHVCGNYGANSDDCGPCVDGEDHSHGSGSSDGSGDGCVSSAAEAPSVPVLAAAAVVALAGLVMAPRRG